MSYRMFLKCSAFFLRMLATVLEHWKIILLLLYFLLPTTPHILLSESNSPRECVYLGPQGLIYHSGIIGCPLLVLITP